MAHSSNRFAVDGVLGISLVSAPAHYRLMRGSPCAYNIGTA